MNMGECVGMCVPAAVRVLAAMTASVTLCDGREVKRGVTRWFRMGGEFCVIRN